MDQPPQDPTPPIQPAQPAPPPGPAWGQPSAPPPQQYAPPPAPGGWAQPAPVGNQWVQPTGVRGPVTGLAKLAGLVILLFGLLWTALGAFFTFIGGAAKVGSGGTALPGFVNSLGDVVAGFGIVLMVIAIIELVGGIGILISKEWGRIIGIAYSLIFGFGSIFIVLGGVSAKNADSVADTSGGGFVALIIGLVFLIGYAYSLVVLMARWRGRA